jgi:molecular chaperone DnaJ
VRGASAGDLYLFVHLKRHPIYAREGTTLIADCPISFTTAALGGSISLPGVDGAKVDIKIPAGVQSGEQLRHRGAGMSVLNGRGRGDLVARIHVETPTRLSKAARGIPRHRDGRRMSSCKGLLHPRPRFPRRLISARAARRFPAAW